MSGRFDHDVPLRYFTSGRPVEDTSDQLEVVAELAVLNRALPAPAQDSGGVERRDDRSSMPGVRPSAQAADCFGVRCGNREATTRRHTGANVKR